MILRGLRFEEATPWNLMRLAANDWISPRFWTQISINRTELGATSGLPTLPLLAGLGYYSGFKETSGLQDEIIDAFEGS